MPNNENDFYEGIIPYKIMLLFQIAPNKIKDLVVRISYSLTLNNLKLLSVTRSVAPISANIAIRSVNQPGITKSNATNLIAKDFA